MHSSRWFLAATALCLAGALSSCSGDGDKNKDSDPGQSAGSSDSPSDSASTGSTPPSGGSQGSVERSCTSVVTVTGAVEDSWEGDATVRLSGSNGPDAVYVSVHKASRISLYSDGKDFEGSATFSNADEAFATPPGDQTGLEIGQKGKAASADADLAGISGPGVHVTAEFTC